MEFKVSKSNILKAVNLVGSVVGTKAATLPILGNILLEIDDNGHLQLTGTDLEVGIFTRIPVEAKQEGSITIPAKKLQDILRELPDGDVHILVAKNNAVNIKAGKAFFKIMGLGKEEYPKLPEWKEENALQLEQALVKECLSLTVFAISNDETRYVLNGILISVKGDKIRFVATDGRRLAYIEKDFKNNTKKGVDMIVPTKAVHEIGKILTWEGEVKVIPSQNQVIFHFGDTYLISRLIEGTFPNFEQVIPTTEKTQSSVNRDGLLQAVRRASLLTSADAPAVKVDFVKGRILVSSRSPNLGESKEEIEAETDGKELSIGFNPYYLTDALKNLDIETVSLSLSDPDKPGLMTGKEGYKYVIMPMQLN